MSRSSGLRVLGAGARVWALIVCAGAIVGVAAATPFEAPPPLGNPGGLDALRDRPAGAARRVEILPSQSTPPGKATAAPARVNGRPFDSRVAAAREHRRPDAAARIREEATHLAMRLQALRRATPAQQADLARLEGTRAAAYLTLLGASPDLAVAWDGDRAIFVTGERLASAPMGPTTSVSPADAAAAAFWDVAAPLFGISTPNEDLQFVRRETDALGQTHLRYQEVHQGVPVWGREVLVHVRGTRVVCVQGRLVPTPTRDAVPSVTSGGAASLAARLEPGATTETPQLVYYVPVDDSRREPVLAWRVRIRSSLVRIADLFIDATDGAFVHRSSCVATDGPVTGSGVDLGGQTRPMALYQVGATYFNINTTKPMFDAGRSDIPQTVIGGIRVLDAQHGNGQQLYFSNSNAPTDWTGKPMDVSAATNGDIVFEYYAQRHSRNSIDGGGGTMELVVNFQNNLNNAFWNGQFMVFGNGDGTHFSDLAAALDAAAHEMTHGVVEHTANLVYETQSGALNESFADVFGTGAEWFAHPASANWLIGEDVVTPGTPGDCLRNLQDPAAANVAFGAQQPARMSDYRNLPNTEEGDNGGVHVNSGIPNHAFYLAATDPALGATAVERVGKAERIWYRALTTYLTRTSQFVDCRLGVVRAAEDLFGGPGNSVAQACASAFDGVEIYDDAPTGPPPTLPPVQGVDYISATDAGNGVLVRGTPDFSSIVPLSSVSILNKPSYTDDGQWVVFIDADSRLRYAHTDGTGEAFLSTVPVWRSIAMSPDGNTLAATSVALDDTLYLLDLTGSGTDHAWAIRTANYGGEGDQAAQFADFLDFSNDGQYVLYDAYNVKSTSSGTYDYWDINVLRAADGDVQRVFPPQPPGVDIGNPTFSPVSDYVIAFDHADAQGNVTVLGCDLENGVVGVITNNYGSLGRPSFAPDGHKVVYQYIDGQAASLWIVSLDPDGVTGAGDDVLVANGGFDPVWFAIGSRTPVALASLSATVGDDGAALVTWDAQLDREHDSFLIARDAGDGWETRSGPLREPAARTGSVDHWEYHDDLEDVPAGVDVVHYRVEVVDRKGTVEILGSIELRLDNAVAPRTVQLFPNTPNPFNPRTTIRFSIGRRQDVRLDVLDPAGRLVRSLWSGRLDAGSHIRIWDGRNDAGSTVASGVYLLRVVAEDGTRARKMVLAK